MRSKSPIAGKSRDDFLLHTFTLKANIFAARTLPFFAIAGCTKIQNLLQFLFVSHYNEDVRSAKDASD